MNAKKDKYMLRGVLKKNGYDWWWHSFTGYNKNNGEPKSFFIEYFIVNPAMKPSDDEKKTKSEFRSKEAM